MSAPRRNLTQANGLYDRGQRKHQELWCFRTHIKDVLPRHQRILKSSSRRSYGSRIQTNRQWFPYFLNLTGEEGRAVPCARLLTLVIPSLAFPSPAPRHHAPGISPCLPYDISPAPLQNNSCLQKANDHLQARTRDRQSFHCSAVQHLVKDQFVRSSITFGFFSFKSPG